MSNKWTHLKEKGNDEFKKKNYSNAISLYSDAIRMDNTQDSTFANRGLCYLSMKKYSPAIADLSKAIVLNPRNMKALKRLSYVHMTLGELPEAEIFLRRCVNLEPKEDSHVQDVRVVRELIKAKDEMKAARFLFDWEKTYTLGELLIAKCSEDAVVKLCYMESSIHTNKADKAITFAKSSLSNSEYKSFEYTYLLAEAYFHDGKFEKSKQVLTNLIAITKDEKQSCKCTKLWENLKLLETEKEQANERFKAGDFDSAVEIYSKLILHGSNNRNFTSVILANRALCYQKQNKFFDAISDLNKSIDLNPKYWKAFYRRATVNVHLRNPEKAKEDLNTVISLDSNNRDAVLLLEEIKREEEKSKKKDLYLTLNVSPAATAEEVRRSFKKLAAQWHPDKNSQTEEMKEYAAKMFREVNEAYNILSDSRKRKAYDEGGSLANLDNLEETDYFNDFNEYDNLYSAFFGEKTKSKSNPNANPNAKTQSKKEGSDRKDKYYKRK